MKIIELIPKLQTGGAEKFVVNLSNELSNMGNDCTLVTLFDLDENDLLAQHISDLVKKYSLGKQIGFDLKCMLRMYKYIKKENPDVVHAHVGAITYLILPAILYRRCRYYATIHADAKYESGSYIHQIIRRILFRIRMVHPITISKESEKSFQQFYKINGHIICNGTPTYVDNSKRDYTQYRKDVDFLFVHVARLQSVKNQLILVRAFDRLVKEGIKARLLLIGRKEEQLVYDAICPYFSDYIVYLGEQIDCRSFMNISDAFCLSSISEGMPITIIEAFSVGCPAIVTPVGGCLNMVKDGYNGILANTTTEEAYYLALKQYVELDENKRNDMSKKAFKSYKEFYSIEKTAQEYLILFKSK